MKKEWNYQEEHVSESIQELIQVKFDRVLILQDASEVNQVDHKQLKQDVTHQLMMILENLI
jgi:hypothetical protein